MLIARLILCLMLAAQQVLAPAGLAAIAGAGCGSVARQPASTGLGLTQGDNGVTGADSAAGLGPSGAADRVGDCVFAANFGGMKVNAPPRACCAAAVHLPPASHACCEHLTTCQTSASICTCGMDRSAPPIGILHPSGGSEPAVVFPLQSHPPVESLPPTVSTERLTASRTQMPALAARPQALLCRWLT